jgi:hypothetical protein
VRLTPNKPLQLTNAPTIVVHSNGRQVRSQLNDRTLGTRRKPLTFERHAWA